MAAPLTDNPYAFRAPGGAVSQPTDPLSNPDPEPDKTDAQAWLAWQGRQASKLRTERAASEPERQRQELARQRSVAEKNLLANPIGQQLSPEDQAAILDQQVTPAPQMPQRIVHEAPTEPPPGMRLKEPVLPSAYRGHAVSSPPPGPPSPGGSYSASASVSGPLGGLKPIMQDYDEQLAGMAEEKEAKERGNAAIGEQYGQVADQQSRMADEQMGAAREDNANARRHLDEIGQLVQDYAQQKIDPMKWWGEKNVPQKIATVIGAMLAGFQGGPKGAQQYWNDQIDRSISLQQEQLGRGAQAIGAAQNLYGSFLKTSENEQQAYDKTRAAMLSSSMLEVQKAAIAARTDEEKAQIDQFMAGLKLQRDMLLARLSAAQSATGAGAAGPNANGLEVDPKQIATGSNGQQYLITNPAYSDDISQSLAVFGRLKDSIKQGQQVLNERRDSYGWMAPYSDNLQRGEAVNGAIYETASKLASARGMPAGLAHVVQQMVPDFGSRLAGPTGAAKIPEVLNLIDQYEQEYLKAAGAVPSKVTIGPGHGKEAYKLKYYAQPGVSTAPGQQAAQAGQRQPGSGLSTFKPGP